MNNKNVRNLVYGGIIGALYVALTLAFLPISFGAIQFRISEALVILPVFTPAAIPGVFIGCLLANWLGAAALPDIIFGSLATLLGAYGTYVLRKKGFLSALPPIIVNALVIPFVLRYAYGTEDMILFMMLTVGIGEIIAVGILGNALRLVLEKYRNIIFKED